MCLMCAATVMRAVWKLVLRGRLMRSCSVFPNTERTSILSLQPRWSRTGRCVCLPRAVVVGTGANILTWMAPEDKNTSTYIIALLTQSISGSQVPLGYCYLMQMVSKLKLKWSKQNSCDAPVRQHRHTNFLCWKSKIKQGEQFEYAS